MAGIGARYTGNGACDFTVWAPFLSDVRLEIVHPEPRTVRMNKDAQGYWSAHIQEVLPGTQYFFRLDESRRRPDPASFSQPGGVHGPTEVVDHGAFVWEDGLWKGIPLAAMLMYELHVGAFTPEGTFAAAIERLDDLIHTGINAIELMPVAQCPGSRNWGYDVAYPFAVQASYGGVQGLKSLINICHKKGVAVILDVVYNHLGPEGNYLRDYGPYFTNRYKTPWGQAVNFDGPCSDQVREYYLENARYWFKMFHADALRLDAVHAIFDFGAKHILAELSERTDALSHKLGRKLYLIAESNLNDPRIITSREMGGHGMNAQWNDDFHHCLHALLTGERSGYYLDFGSPGQLAKSMAEGFVYSWTYSPYHQRHHGCPSGHLPADRFVVFAQNHDQIGNRMFGERLAALVPFEALKLAAALVLLSPGVPLLFMGEEYGEEAPFPYFVDHSDSGLIRSVREGRKKEFEAFGWAQEPPDPQSEETFIKAKLDWCRRSKGKNHILHEYYRHLIAFRDEKSALACYERKNIDVKILDDAKMITAFRYHAENVLLCIFNVTGVRVSVCIPLPQGIWRKLSDSSEKRWLGPGESLPDLISAETVVTMHPYAAAVYERQVPS